MHSPILIEVTRLLGDESSLFVHYIAQHLTKVLHNYLKNNNSLLNFTHIFAHILGVLGNGAKKEQLLNYPSTSWRKTEEIQKDHSRLFNQFIVFEFNTLFHLKKSYLHSHK